MALLPWGFPGAEDVVEDDAEGRRDVDCVFETVHGDLDDGVAAFERAVGDAGDFVAEYDGDGGRPVVVVHGDSVRSDFDGDACDGPLAERVQGVRRAFVVGPGDVVERAEGGLFEFGMRRVGAHAAEVDVRDGAGVGRAEDGTDVVGAAEVVENDVDGMARQVGERAAGHAGIMGFGLAHGVESVSLSFCAADSYDAGKWPETAAVC